MSDTGLKDIFKLNEPFIDLTRDTPPSPELILMVRAHRHILDPQGADDALAQEIAERLASEWWVYGRLTIHAYWAKAGGFPLADPTGPAWKLSPGHLSLSSKDSPEFTYIRYYEIEDGDGDSAVVVEFVHTSEGPIYGTGVAKVQLL